MHSLNNNQQKAVSLTEQRCRVVAGAGSGKTRVLAHRFAYLVNEIGISAANILCLTFTNKAAQEMKRRISSMVDGGSVNDFICTIHSFCTKFLRREIYRLGYPANFTVLDEEDSKILANQTLIEFGIDRRKTTAERFLDKVAAFKGANARNYIPQYLLPDAETDVGDPVVRFLKLQLKQFALDYDDLLYFTCYILENFPDASEFWTSRLNYIMIDEAQDCSSDDWRLLRLLEKKHHNLFIVGDPDQAIYEWRGANPKLFIDFQADNDVVLNRNYRSTPDILNVANSIIKHNKQRIEKDLFTIKLNERPVTYTHFKSEPEEAAAIADIIETELASGKMPNDFAILYRSSFLSRRIEQELLKRNIPYTIWGGVKFFERKEIKDVICYLRLIANDLDDIAFMRIINTPARKFGKVSLSRLKQIADATGTSLFQALQDNLHLPIFGKAPVKAFVDIILNARNQAQSLPVSELTDRVMTAVGLANEYRNDRLEDRLENIAELINAMREFESQALDEEDATLYGYLQEIALFTQNDDIESRDKVRLMTIHQSKGLEFPTVFIIGLTEGVFPNHRSIRERRKEGEEEERRLMYVAVTRAQSRLYLSESEGYLNDNGALKYPSRFLAEIPQEELEIKGNPDPGLLKSTHNLVSALNSELGISSDNTAENIEFPPGTPVNHKVFGEGIVEEFDASSKSYKVRFGDIVRNLVARVLTKSEK